MYLLSRKGRMFIMDIEKPDAVLSECRLGEECYASPAFSDGRIYIRGKENLYCVGAAENVDKPTRLTEEEPVLKAKAGGWPGGRLTRMGGVASTLEGSWPSFRGAQRDGVARDAGDLAKSWGEGAPPTHCLVQGRWARTCRSRDPPRARLSG